MKRFNLRSFAMPILLCGSVIIVPPLLGTPYTALHAQTNNTPQKRINVKLSNVNLVTVFNYLRKEADVKILYYEGLDGLKSLVNIDLKNSTVAQVLDHVLKSSALEWTFEKGAYVVREKTKNTLQQEQMVQVDVTVKSLQGQGLPGATIQETSTGKTFLTNEQGALHYSGAPDAILRVSYVGMESQLLTVKGKTLLNITLLPDVRNVQEVVINGYQKLDRRELASSIVTLREDEIKMPGVNRIDQLLQGKVAGMSVVQESGGVGASPKIRIRGTSTLIGNREPVWVIDGVIQSDPLPFRASDLNTGDMRTIIGNSVASLNPEDIENMHILKDASATAIYGVKAANGVIVINTKRGATGPARISLTSGFTFAARPYYGQYNLMNAAERIEVAQELYGRGVTPLNGKDSIGYEALLMAYYDKRISQAELIAGEQQLASINTDWFDLLFRNSLTQNYSISTSGGNDRTSYYTSASYAKENGTAIGNDGDRFSARLRINSQLTKKVKIDVMADVGQSNPACRLGDHA